MKNISEYIEQKLLSSIRDELRETVYVRETVYGCLERGYSMIDVRLWSAVWTHIRWDIVDKIDANIKNLR